MNVLTASDGEEMTRRAATLVLGRLNDVAAPKLLLAMGRTPLGAYSKLAGWAMGGRFDAGKVTVVELDEYWGLEETDSRRLARWLERSVVLPWGVDPGHVVYFDTSRGTPEEVCAAYDSGVRALGGIDLAVLGIGSNGHLGFNEPPSLPSSPTRLVKLSQASVQSNGSYWGGESHCPTSAVTAGMDIILAAREIILLVSGENKRSVLRRALNEPPSPEVPASYLQHHDNVTVVTDTDAFSSYAESRQ
jgi:glucosamine-6-phosphate deaminase